MPRAYDHHVGLNSLDNEEDDDNQKPKLRVNPAIESKPNALVGKTFLLTLFCISVVCTTIFLSIRINIICALWGTNDGVG